MMRGRQGNLLHFIKSAHSARSSAGGSLRAAAPIIAPAQRARLDAQYFLRQRLEQKGRHTASSRRVFGIFIAAFRAEY